MSGGRIGGQIDSAGTLSNPYGADAPWAGSALAGQPAAGGDVQTALLKAISAVHANMPPAVVSFLGSTTGEIVLTTLLILLLMGGMLLLMAFLIQRQTS